MPTPKQVREHYKRLRYHMWQLQKALNDAHNADVIVYDATKFAAEAPCACMHELRLRIEKTTEATRAKAMKDEIMSEMKAVY